MGLFRGHCPGGGRRHPALHLDVGRTGMSPQDKIQLVSGLLDLPILDAEYRYCGIVDDVELEFDRSVRRVTALLAGPGAYGGRLPPWCFRFVRWVAGDRIVRVP